MLPRGDSLRRSIAYLAASALLVTSVGFGAPVAAQTSTDPCQGAPRAPYVDVGDSHTHADAIDCLHGLGIVEGRLIDAFAPASSLRRDQMATLIAGAITQAGGSLPGPDRDAFDDVATNVHRDAIERLAAAGIVQGRSTGRYDPGARVPRGQMTVFLVEAHDHLLGPSTASTPDAFEDDDGHRYEEFIDRAAQLGLASGRSGTTFEPDGHVTRAQTATFVAKLLALASQGGVMAAGTWGFDASVSALPASLRTQMTGSSWHAGRGCPAFDDLRLLEIVHRGFDGRDRVGLLVLHRDATSVVRAALEDSYRSGFRIQRMRLVDRYGADDDRSMAANNTSAFNCRTVAGTDRLSQHGHGRALDINPIQNPYVTSGGAVYPPAGASYRDRSNVRTGMLTANGATVRAFTDRGWGWGGTWTSSKDYQHLSANGR